MVNKWQCCCFCLFPTEVLSVTFSVSPSVSVSLWAACLNLHANEMSERSGFVSFPDWCLMSREGDREKERPTAAGSIPGGQASRRQPTMTPTASLALSLRCVLTPPWQPFSACPIQSEDRWHHPIWTPPWHLTAYTPPRQPVSACHAPASQSEDR